MRMEKTVQIRCVKESPNRWMTKRFERVRDYTTATFPHFCLEQEKEGPIKLVGEIEMKHTANQISLSKS